MCVYIYIYMCVCVCACVCVRARVCVRTRIYTWMCFIPWCLYTCMYISICMAGDLVLHRSEWDQSVRSLTLFMESRKAFDNLWQHRLKYRPIVLCVFYQRSFFPPSLSPFPLSLPSFFPPPIRVLVPACTVFPLTGGVETPPNKRLIRRCKGDCKQGPRGHSVWLSWRQHAPPDAYTGAHPPPTPLPPPPLLPPKPPPTSMSFLSWETYKYCINNGQELQTGRQIDIQTGRNTDGQTHRKADIQTGRRTKSQTERPTDQADGPIVRQTNRHSSLSAARA